MSSKSVQDKFFVGIDVGTGSARAGIFDARGKQLATAVREIQIWRPEPEYAEQSSSDIWKACCQAVRQALAASAVSPSQIAGLGFDATCSLVAVDGQGNPVSISPTGRDEQNIIGWMDHRAIAEAEEINAQGFSVLKYVGGRISPEMETPKLLWLKRHLPQSWKRARYFFDLADWLSWRCTGDDARSLCTTVCKWTYLGHEAARGDSLKGWDADYFQAIGLGDLVDEGFKRIGTRILPMGTPLGNGLTVKAAEELGLPAGCAVGVGIIDAHAGGLGMLGAPLGGSVPSEEDFDRRLALIGGTSTCHMAVSREPRFIPGIWGPYYSAMIPGFWLTEGGQSATGALVDHVIYSHARAADLKEESNASGKSVYQLLNERLEDLSRKVDFPARLTEGFHILPYFHGNRSPRANPALRGMVSGLSLSDSIDELALLYLAAIQAIALGTRHIIAEMNAQGYRIDTLFACGGGTKNPVFLREHADITGCRLALPGEPEAVLLGSAVLGAVASGVYGDIPRAMAAMNAPGNIVEPAKGAVAEYHRRKYEVFLRMHDDQMAYRKMMKG